MKVFGTIIFVVALVLGTAYVGGIFDADVSVSVEPEVKQNVSELTYDTLNKAQKSIDKAFRALKSKIK